MNKIIATALLAITVAACKKEPKTITKTDPVTGRTVTTQVQGEPTRNAPETTAVSTVMAIRDSAGIFRQYFILEKGHTYPLTTYTRNLQTVSNAAGKSMSGSSESTDEMTFTVNDLKAGVYDITVNLIGKRNSESANGKTAVVDTRTAAPADPNLKMMWNVNKALVGTKLSMKLKQNGTIVSVTGFEPVYSKVSAAAGTMIKDGKEKTAFLNSFRAGFNANTIKDQFEANLKVLPAAGAKIGGKWTKSVNASPDGKVKLSTNFLLKSVADGVATISVSGGIPQKSEKRTEQGVTQSISSQMTQTGTILLDQQSGWIKNQNMTVKAIQSQSISDGKHSETVKSTTVSTVMVNPSNK